MKHVTDWKKSTFLALITSIVMIGLYLNHYWRAEPRPQCPASECTKINVWHGGFLSVCFLAAIVGIIFLLAKVADGRKTPPPDK